MNKQVDYTVVASFSMIDLTKFVNHKLKQGYRCIGGVACRDGELLQALAKYESRDQGNRNRIGLG